jgi:hypothetical protein
MIYNSLGNGPGLKKVKFEEISTDNTNKNEVHYCLRSIMLRS